MATCRWKQHVESNKSNLQQDERHCFRFLATSRGTSSFRPFNNAQFSATNQNDCRMLQVEHKGRQQKGQQVVCCFHMLLVCTVLYTSDR